MMHGTQISWWFVSASWKLKVVNYLGVVGSFFGVNGLKIGFFKGVINLRFFFWDEVTFVEEYAY